MKDSHAQAIFSVADPKHTPTIIKLLPYTKMSMAQIYRKL